MKNTARSVAYDALMRVTVDDAYLDRVLPSAFERARLSPEDRGLANELAYGVLRRRALLDRVIAQFVDRPLHKLDDHTLTALRLGAYQMVVLERVPAHAAVGETVEVMKQRRKSAAGLVNAVLRKISTAPRPELAFTPAELPAWLYARLVKPRSFSLDPALAWRAQSEASERDLLESLAQPAHPSFRVLSKRLGRDALLAQLQAQGGNAWALAHVPCGVGVSRIGEVTQLEGFGTSFFAQDEAAQWVVELARDERGPGLDACAAPGGKTLAMWDLGITPLTALEIQPNRRELLDKTLLKAGVEARVLTGDASKPPHGSFNTVLIDAPCTGSGTLKRHPELRWRLEEKAVDRLAAIQTDILKGLAGSVASGGTLIYAVCSIFEEEGAAQIQRFLADHPNYTLERWLDTRSAMHVMDGFFAAKLRKKN